MDSLKLRVQYKLVESSDEPSLLGIVGLEHGPSSATLLTPDTIDPSRLYPLITVLHGAGRQDEALAKGYRNEANARQAFFLIPRSVDPTWDLIVGGERHDLDFFEYAYDLIYRRYPIDPLQQALIGYSDGASYALSIGLSNLRMFSALLVWAAGFVVVDPATAEEFRAQEGPSSMGAKEPLPRIYLEYGTHDQLFNFETVALPMRDNLKRAGFDVTFSVDEGGRHWPSGSFQAEALDWFFDGVGTTS